MKTILPRRIFVAGVGALLLQPLMGVEESKEKPVLRFGVVTDLHYGNMKTVGTRHYRDSRSKLAEAVKVFTARKIDFMIELGDFKDLAREQGKASIEGTKQFAREIEETFAAFKGPRYHVLGNHDNDCLNNEEILPLYANTGIASGKSYYAFVANGIRCLVLDGNFNKKMEHYRGHPCNWDWIDSNIPPEEVAWLKGELAASKEPVLVFVHQRLDSKARAHHRIQNGEAVQKILAASGKVKGVFQGHDHIGGFSFEHNVNYYTLPAMVEGPTNSFAEVAVYPSGKIAVTGFARAGSRQWGPAAPDALTPRARAQAAFDAFLKAYWVEEKSFLRRHKDRNKPFDFWFAAHAWDMLIDADRLFRTTRTRTLMTRFYDAFTQRHPDFLKNEYNDDILWWTIALTNAYRHTRDRRYLAHAQKLFDHLVAHEIDDTLGGGMWWKNSAHTCKNACDNFPAVITACNLAQLTKQKKYLETARTLFAWSRAKFFDPKTGAVYDNVNLEGKLTRWDFTYNCGTFIGSALRLHRLTGDASFLADAKRAGRHFREDLSSGGIIKPCGKGDGGAFHGVGFRYLAELAARADCADVRAYLCDNAAQAWANRRPSDDLVGNDWRRVPRDDFDIEGQVANSALTLFLQIPLLKD